MRFVLVRVLAVAAFAVALVAAPGCGGKSQPVDPAVEALSYLPADPPLAFTLETNASALDRVTSVLEPVAAFRLIQEELRSDLEADQFDRDFKPWLGNPAFFAFPDARAANDDQYVAAIVATNEKALGDALSRWVKDGRAKKEADLGGEAVYSDPDGGTLSTQRGSTFVAATSRPLLEAAVERHEAKTGMTKAAFSKKLAGLPSNAPVAFAGSMPKMFDSAETARGREQVAQARRIPWIAAMGAVAGTFTTQGSEARFDIKVDTTGRQLTEAQLPLASGAASSAAGLRSPKDASEAIRVTDYSHIQTFSLESAKAVNPAGYAKFSSGIDLIDRELGVDVQRDLVEQFTADTVISFSPKGVTVVAGVARPADLERTLGRLKPVIAQFLSGAGLSGVSVSEKGGTYELTRDGLLAARFAVVDGSFVVTIGDEQPRQAVGEASIERSTPPGAIVTWIDPSSDFGLVARIVGAIGSPAVAVESLDALSAIATGMRTDPGSTSVTLTATVKPESQ